jgi:hypothetical protein
MAQTGIEIQRFEVPAPQSAYKIEAVGLACGNDLIIVIGGGSRYHLGAIGLTISLPSIITPESLTTTTYQLPLPGHKEDVLAREASKRLSRKLAKNVAVTVGIHEDNLTLDGIEAYTKRFYELIDRIESYYLS